MSAIRTVRAGDIDIAYRLEGPQGAPVVMLVHGLLASHRMWDALVDALTGPWRVLRPDLRGHGATTVTRAPYSMAQLAGDLVQLLDSLAIDRAHFVGSSLGGMIGQYLGAHHGERLHSLTLANTTASQAAPQAWQERIARAQREGVATLVDATLDRWFSADFLASGSPRLAQARDAALATSVEGYWGCASAVRDLDQAALLSGIRVPTLVLTGELDAATPPGEGLAIHTAIAGSQIVQLPAAHQAAVEVTELFAAAWERFVHHSLQQETT